MKIHGTAKGGAISKKDFGVAFSEASVEPLDDENLVGYWKFNESSGNIINVSESDESLGSAANISMTGGTYDVTGTPSGIGNGVTFDGSSDYGTFGTSTSQFNFMHNTSAVWTLAFWMKLNVIGSDDTLLATKINNDGGTPGYSIRLRTNNVIKTFILNGSATILSAGSSDDFIPDTSSWYFYTMTYDQSEADDNLVIRRNNANEETGDKTANTPSNSNAGYAQHIARRPDASSDFGDFSIAELSQWNRVLTDDEITALYNSGAGRSIY